MLAQTWVRARSFEMGRASVSILAAAIALASLPFALFGLLQLGATTVAQLSGPAQVTDFVAIYSGAHLAATEPAKVYAPAAVAALDHALTGLDRFDRPFSFAPHAALLLVLLGWLPFGVAYVLWLIIGVAALSGATWCLAPRARWWPLLLVLFLPAQLGLIMGQTSPLALLALCALVRLIDRRPGLAG